MQRLAKAISNAGVCSRRDAEKLIGEGKVKLDDVVITSPAINVSAAQKIEVLGAIIQQKPRVRLWRYYKPRGLITTHKDPLLRKTVFNDLSDLPRIISIGRLDLASEGLLLLTNNGDYARKFELPSNKIERIYKVRAHGDPEPLLRSATLSIEIGCIYYCPKSIKLINKNISNSWFEVILTEGKNREIRKIFKYFGLGVNRLIRVQYGDFVLGNLKPREYQEVQLA